MTSKLEKIKKKVVKKWFGTLSYFEKLKKEWGVEE